MSGGPNSKELSMVKTIASNLPRAGILAIPGIGAAFEKAIFGPLDDKAREEAQRQILDALEELSVDVCFAKADLRDELAMLAEKIRESNVELAEKIEQLDPIRIENFIVQNIRPTIVNVFLKITPEEIRSLSSMAGMLPSELSVEDNPERMGAVLFDNAARQGSLSAFVGKLANNHPSLLEQFSEVRSTSTIEDLKAKLADASRSLLKWPTTLGNKIWLHRGELDLLEERVTSAEGTANLILGKPGTGKSAILASLGQRLINKGVPVLAVKADMLARSIQDFDDLQTHLHLPFPVMECLSIVSRSEPTVLIIDQLDALSEFVDRYSERLNLLLDLIQIVSGMDEVHVVTSCRWFEYQHDIRLTTIEAERISLDPPSWEDVKSVLKDAGFPEEHWSDEARNLLSTPLHLKILLDLKSRDPEAKVPSSLQGLLENIWQQRIISGETGSGKLSFLDILCKRMSEEEELWVPRALADGYVHIFEELQQANILQLDPSSLKIGFVHQTYFDFARARAFATGKERLSEHVIQRQDGLFIRPILLSTLDFLREASPATYEKEVRYLWEDEDLRPHLRSLLIDYLGSVEKPNDTEISCLLPMLEERQQGYKALLAMAGSPGWLSIIKDVYLPTLMSQGPEFAHFSIPTLSRAFSFAKNEVVRIVKDIWIPDGNYDEHVLMLFTYLGDWDETSIEIICEVAKRHESHWIPHIADLVSQSKPDLAPRIVRADFDRRLQDAMRKEAEAIVPPPPPPDSSDEEKVDKQEKEEIGQSILWGHGFSFSLPGGRGVYIKAIADGYLLREPPEYEASAEVIQSRLSLENHPEIWKVSLHSMAFLFNWDGRKAASYFDHVITNFKDVRESKLGALGIGMVLHLVPEHETIERWLILLRDSTTSFGQQAFGELVMLCLFRNPEDRWAKDQIDAALDSKELTNIHRGLAFAASYNWNSPPHQDLCTKVLVELSASNDEVVQEAVSQVFEYGEKVILNDNMKRVIEAILPHDQVLLKSADRLIEGIMDQTASEPEIIGCVCNRVLEAGKTEIQNIGSQLSFIAEPIVSIALTLHRKLPPYRAIGLELFERLIDSNIPHARQALDILDRKPVSPHAPRPMRRRRRRRRS